MTAREWVAWCLLAGAMAVTVWAIGREQSRSERDYRPVRVCIDVAAGTECQNRPIREGDREWTCAMTAGDAYRCGPGAP